MTKLKRINALTFNWTTGLTCFLFAVVCGIYLTKSGLSIYPEFVLIFAILSMLSTRRRKLMWIIIMVFFGLSLGLWRGGQFQQNFLGYEKIYDKKVVFTAKAKSDGVYDDRKQLEFDVGDIEVVEEGLVLPGKMTVSGFGAPAVTRGDNLQIEGKIHRTLGGKVGRASFAKVEVLSHTDSVVEHIRQKFVAGMYSALPEPAASFGLGLLIGQRTTLPKDVDQDLRKVGLVHIVAVSGYNLTILVLFSRRLLEKHSKYQATLLSGLLVVGFLLITGFSASIVRAAIVSGLSLVAWYFGRTIRPLLLISIAAAITGMASPLYIWFDIGWYLSFLAFFGILVLSPLLVLRFSKSDKLMEYKQLFSDTFAAQVMTIPIIMFIFAKISLIGFIVNLIVVPFVPFAMLFSFIAGVAGMTIPAVAGLFALPAKILLVAILDVAQVFAQIPHALVATKINGVEMVICYILIILLCVVLYQKTKGLRDIISTEKDLL